MSAIIQYVLAWATLSLLMSASHGLSWPILLSAAVTVAILAAVANACGLTRWKLFWPLVAVYGGIGVINIEIDVLFLHIAPITEAARQTAVGLMEVATVSAVLAFAAAGGPRTANAQGLASSLWWRIPMIAATYVVLYVIAGALVFPYVKEFYQTSHRIVLPSSIVGPFLGEVFLRGLVYVAALLPLFWRMPGRRLQAGVIAGAAMAILGGVAPLLLPNEIMPPRIRLFHVPEVVSENFVLGLVAAWLLVRQQSVQRPSEPLVMRMS